MATQVTPVRRMIFFEGARFRSANSEELIQRIGGSINFVNLYQYEVRDFVANGAYNGPVSYPLEAVDGFSFFKFNVEIIDAWAWVQLAGSGGTTELDIKVATAPGGGFASIFSTTPKIDAAAGDNVWVHLGSVVPNTVAPVLATPNLDADWAVRMDIITAQTGVTVNGAGIQLHYRPR